MQLNFVQVFLRTPQPRNTMKYVVEKDRKEFASDLKTIYEAPDEPHAQEALGHLCEKLGTKYANVVKSWERNLEIISPIFNFFCPGRKDIPTANAIEGLNSTYRRLNGQRSVFPNAGSLLKALQPLKQLKNGVC